MHRVLGPELGDRGIDRGQSPDKVARRDITAERRNRDAERQRTHGMSPKVPAHKAGSPKRTLGVVA